MAEVRTDEGVKSKERESLGWRVAVVFMVLGVPFIAFGSWTLMTSIQASKDIEIKRIEHGK